MNSPDTSSVVLKNISKKFSSFTAIPDLTLTIERGSLVTLLGPSGCGKTTTLRIIAGLEYPSSGHVLIGGQDVTRRPANERDVSMVFQSYALFPHMNVLENICYGLVSSGLKKHEARDKAHAVLEQVGLPDYGRRLPAELSGGQQQRVALARALVLEPQVLLLDEPLSNLDARLRRQMRTDIRDLQQRLGFTAVYVTHDQEEALAVSDKIVVMDKGCVAQEGSPQQLYQEPNSVFIADFIGEANIIDCQIESKSAVGSVANIAGYKIALNRPDVVIGAAKLAVRPNAIVLRRLETKQEAEGSYYGTVVHATYLGHHLEYVVKTENDMLFALDPIAETQLKAGDLVAISFRKQGVTYIPQA